MLIEAHCDDGSDRRCKKIVEINLPFSGLVPSDVKSILQQEKGHNILNKSKGVASQYCSVKTARPELVEG